MRCSRQNQSACLVKEIEQPPTEFQTANGRPTKVCRTCRTMLRIEVKLSRGEPLTGAEQFFYLKHRTPTYMVNQRFVSTCLNCPLPQCVYDEDAENPIKICPIVVAA